MIETFKKLVFSSNEETETDGFWNMKKTGVKKNTGEK